METLNPVVGSTDVPDYIQGGMPDFDPFPDAPPPLNERKELGLVHSHDKCTRVVHGEASRWEERLKGSKQRLHVMRMERAQWHAMVQAADTQQHGEPTFQASQLYQGALADSGCHLISTFAWFQWC